MTTIRNASKWNDCLESFPDTFGDYSVIDVIWNDGTESLHSWRISDETKDAQMKDFTDRRNMPLYPIMWRYSKRWLDKKAVENNFEINL